jgi:HlyD family secretion protein
MSYGTMPLDVVLGGKKGNSAESLVRLVDDSTYFVEADIDEADAGRVRAGQEARLTIDALGGEVLRGVVSRVSPAVSTAELSSRTVRVEVEVKGRPEIGTDPGGGPREGNGPPATPPLSVGMSADVEIILDRVDGVLTVPTLVILEEGDEKTVFVVEAGKLSRRRIVLGVANWERSEIREGLAEGDRVVIPADRAKLIEGLAVECAPTEEPGRG